MKKTLIYFAAAAGTILAASSCCGEMSYKEYGFTENAALKDGLDAALDISIMMEYPDGGLADETISKICNAITVTAFGEEYAGMFPQDAVNACAEKYIASYREINLELAGSEAGAGIIRLCVIAAGFLDSRSPVAVFHGGVVLCFTVHGVPCKERCQDIPAVISEYVIE